MRPENLHRQEPAPVLALRTNSLVDERPAALVAWRRHAVAFALGACLGASLVFAYFWWRIDRIDPRPPYLHDRR